MSESSPLPPEWKPVAFKEWQIVCEAIASGEQSLILRKGGISEGKHGFQWIHDRFLLFPSYFHEQLDQVKNLTDGSPRKLNHPPVAKPGTDGAETTRAIEFSVYCETLETGRLTDWAEIATLDSEHIWKESVIRERYDWGDEKGISFARVKAHVLEKPIVLADRAGFGGCRSWIGLPKEEVFSRS
jgi:hypothetical protein